MYVLTYKYKFILYHIQIRFLWTVTMFHWFVRKIIHRNVCPYVRTNIQLFRQSGKRYSYSHLPGREFLVSILFWNFAGIWMDRDISKSSVFGLFSKNIIGFLRTVLRSMSDGILARRKNGI